MFAEVDDSALAVQKLKSDVKALEDQREALRAELQEATLTHEGDTTEIRGLQVRSQQNIP